MRAGRWLLLCLALALGAITQVMATEPPHLPILVYHQIRNGPAGPPDSLEAISLARFEAQMRHLRDQGYATLSAQEVVEYVRGAPAPASKIVAIHFDDGWKSAQLAIPVLDRFGFKATFWIIAGKGIGWPHMDWEEVQALARNPRYDVQSHSMTHPWKDGDTLLDWMAGRVPGKEADQVRWELRESRRVLAEKLGRPVSHFAWPRGLYDESLVGIAVEEGYAGLFTVDDGVNRQGDDVRRLRRTMVHGGCDDDVFAQIVRDGVYRACDTIRHGAAPRMRSAAGAETRR